MSAELLAPAGDFETALAAFDAGADAVYCGLAGYSARAFAKNLSPSELRVLMRVAAKRARRVYVTFNTIVDEGDLEDAIARLAELEEIGPDGLIVQDLGIARLCRRHFPRLKLHASTQLVAHNLEGVTALKELGFTRVVLARELSLAEIAYIAKRCGGMELECFIHGALCYSISGLCLFSAMEKGRSGNRGRCAYCCRLPYEDGDGGNTLAFSMKDLRLGEDVRKLADAGVASLKIEGRMKSALYVASATSYYRQILGPPQDRAQESPPRREATTVADLETVFSRRTTELYFNGPAEDVIDPVSLGHLGTPIGTVKRVTKDREGMSWLRFHTSRRLEKHDGLQFAAPGGGKPPGLGIIEMRQAISRTPVFEVAAGTDVEILVADPALAASIRPGATVYCSMSNEVKRRFPAPGFRPSDYPGGAKVDVRVEIAADAISAEATCGETRVARRIAGEFGPAKNPAKTYAAVEKAFSKLGGTDYAPGALALSDTERLFVPMSVLNDLRREIAEALDEARAKTRSEKIEAATGEDVSPAVVPSDAADAPARTVKIRAGQKIPSGAWDEVVVEISRENAGDVRLEDFNIPVRLALPVYTAEQEFGSLRVAVKRLLRAGFDKWEASDLATLHMLRALGVDDITADWTLYAFNSHALKALSDLGVKRFTASPENSPENLAFLAESGYRIEFLAQQSTPLFISQTKPAAESVKGLAIFRRHGLWVTTRPVPRVFETPRGAPVRIDIGWSREC